MLHNLGRVDASSASWGRVPHHQITALLDRHARGDWGDLGPDDKAANDAADRSSAVLRNPLPNQDRMHFLKLYCFTYFTKRTKRAGDKLTMSNYLSSIVFMRLLFYAFYPLFVVS